MQVPTKRDDPSEQSQPAPKQGAPASHAAHAERKNVPARVLARPTAGELEELREDGYGHGV